MALQRAAQNAELGSLKPIELNGTIYEPVDTVRALREQRSRVSKFDDDDLRPLPEFKYHRLQSMRRRIRLLRLVAGSQNNPDIICELFEVEFDMHNVVRRLHQPQPPKHSRKRSKSLTPEEQRKHEENTHVAETVEYEALSWNWGTESRDCGIRVLQGNNHPQRRLAISRELALALKHLRNPDHDRILWIDALCINQADHEERNHQVQMMSRIYNCAQQVCVWLGQDNDDSTTAISFIREIMLLENFDAISEKKENAPKWRSLSLLMQRPWFSRKWVVQEIALARVATIYCGNDQIPWEQFAVAVELFVEVETATHRLSEVMRRDEAFGHVPQWFEHVSELGASVLVQATGKIFRRDGWQAPNIPHSRPNGIRKTKRGAGGRKTPRLADAALGEPSEIRPQRPLLSLEYLVSSLSVFQASQPRDAIYSLLAISRDTSPFAELRANSEVVSEEATILSTVSSFLERKPFKVDYSRPFSDVCKDFVSFCIQGARNSDPTRALDILCRPWAPDPTEQGVGGVVHRKPVPYKSNENRSHLWMPKEKERQPKSDESQLEVDERSTSDYYKDVRSRDDLERYDDSQQLYKAAEKFLPQKRTQPQSPVRNEGNENSDDSESDDELEIEEESMKLPSWISPVSGAPFALFHHPGGNSMLRMGRKNADPLVGLPQDGHRNYSAAQNTKVDHKSDNRLRFRKRPRLGHYSLYTKGFIFDEIAEVREPARLGCIPETWTKLAGVGQKGGLRGGSVDTSALIVNERNSIVAEFCRRVQAVIWNRCLVKTKKGRLGLANMPVQQGDLVCIIFGCTVPVILRREPPKKAEDVENEEWQDRFESFRSVLSICEEACFRKLRYKRKLESLVDVEREAWEYEVQEEMKAVNHQIEIWQEREKGLNSQKEAEEKEKTMRKNEAEERKKKRADSIGPHGGDGGSEADPDEMKSTKVPEKQDDMQREEMEKRQQEKQRAREEDQGLYYTLISEAYIHGMMDGDAVREHILGGTEDEMRERLFEIR
ncbi:heterokaryon incompatibility protein-domain-containing protein [Apiospora arundinis]